MNPFKELLSGGLAGIGEAFGKVVAKFKADPTKVAEITAELEQAKIAADLKLQELEVTIEQEITKRIESENKAVTDRWTADMASDSWLSKNTRPLVLLSLLVFLYLLIIFDSAIAERFEVKEEYIELLKMSLDLALLAYFGGRTAEKFKSIHEGSKVARK